MKDEQNTEHQDHEEESKDELGVAGGGEVNPSKSKSRFSPESQAKAKEKRKKRNEQMRRLLQNLRAGMSEDSEDLIMPENVKQVVLDMQDAAKNLPTTEVRFLVDLYYQIQDFRIQAQGQIRSMLETMEPTRLISWVFFTSLRVEEVIRQTLEIYTDNEPTGMGKWAKENYGIAGVLSAGLLSQINLEPWKCVHSIEIGPNGKFKKACTRLKPHGEECHVKPIETVGSIWRFGGLDPTVRWEKGQKRPWNASFKTTCWKIGQSFMKFSGRPQCYYGKLYLQRKALEVERNAAGLYAEQAKQALERKKIRPTTDAYKCYVKGMLPPAHLDARARRWTVKIFLYDWFAEAYWRRYNRQPPMPYVISQLGHAHLMRNPHSTSHLARLNNGNERAKEGDGASTPSESKDNDGAESQSEPNKKD